MDLSQFDFIVINTSAGKDSQAMMDYVMGLARSQGVVGRVVAVHADLGRVEWKGTRELAEEHCRHYGIPLEVVRREAGDLLAQVSARGKWPDSGNRYCTSDQKRDQVAKLQTRLVSSLGKSLGRRARILNCMGFRAEESPARAKRLPISTDERLTNGKREVINWLPIHAWTVVEVWAAIRASGVPHHRAYDLGMPRLSCCFCIFAPESALLLAGKHNPELLAEYVATEKSIGHTFRHKFTLASVQEKLVQGFEPGPIQSWTM